MPKTNFSFPKKIKIGKRWVGEGCPAFFIAEIGANFDGSLEKAKRLVLAAKEAGADVAKFQTFLSHKIVAPGGFAKMKLKGVHGTWGRPVHEVFKEVEFPRRWHKEISDYCRKVGIMFSSAPYDFEGADLLDRLNVPFIKIGSGEITWHEMLRHIAEKKRPMILATGASTLAEVDEALKVITQTGNRNLILLQCITNYPSKIESANINVLKTYEHAFNIITGYSDHTPGDVVPLGAIALGGKVIEKHFTLSRKDKGPDHPHSMEPQEFKAMIERVRMLEKAMGSTIKDVVPEESETVIVQRRGLYLKNNISKGQRIKKSDLTELRPALGILPKYKERVAGLVAKRRLSAGEPLFWEHLV
ncbi:MAG: N-acetylneuraminate synthase family protein [bacterium]|nr:N-acetylneuraminate synthase family protein [bacterium]